MKTWIARRPVHSVLATNKVAELTGIQPRPWQMALEEYVREFIT
jgi:dTDP-4-dehydrorhamnose reductase